ncbi:hypothetical protein ACFE04_027100 [Oxalis oulophora]
MSGLLFRQDLEAAVDLVAVKLRDVTNTDTDRGATAVDGGERRVLVGLSDNEMGKGQFVLNLLKRSFNTDTDRGATAVDGGERRVLVSLSDNEMGKGQFVLNLPKRSFCFKRVVKRANVSMEAFFNDYFLFASPVIFTDCMNHWPAITKWNDFNYLTNTARNRTVPVEVGKNYLCPEWKQELITFTDFLKRIQSNDSSPGSTTYLAQHPLFEQGWAVRVGEPILRGTFVCELIGEVLDELEANKRRTRFDNRCCIFSIKLCFSKLNGDFTFSKPNLVNYQVLVDIMDSQHAHIGLYAIRDGVQKNLSTTCTICKLIKCVSLEISASKRRLPKLVFGKTLRIIIQRAEEAKYSGGVLPLLTRAKTLFNHVESGLSENNNSQHHQKEDVFRFVLILHSLLENPPGDFRENLREDIVQGFVRIFSFVRGEGKTSRKLLECMNTYLIKDGPNLGSKTVEIHNALQQFVFRSWLTTHDRGLKDVFIFYSRLQQNLTKTSTDGSRLLEQILDVICKELDQNSLVSAALSWGDASKDDKYGKLSNSQRGLVELAALVLYRSPLKSTQNEIEPALCIVVPCHVFKLWAFIGILFQLIARDLHDNEWKFRHIFRGQPKRHLLTTGWSVFVSAKRLVAGDFVLFIWGDNIRDAFYEKSRTPDPQRLLRAYLQSVGTLNLRRAFATGGYATMQRVSQWNLDFVQSSEHGDRYFL